MPKRFFASGTDFFALNLKNNGMDPKLKSLIKDPAKDMFFCAKPGRLRKPSALLHGPLC